MDDAYTRFNRKHVDDRQIDTLIGIAKGVLADGTVNQSEYDRLVEELRGKITVTEIDPGVRKAWAESLAAWPQSMADELEAQGLPAKQVLNLVLEKAEARGYEWPERYEIK